MICSSVNLHRFIRPSLPSGRTLRIPGGVSGGQVTPPTPPGIRVPYHGGSTELGLGGRTDLGKTERLEIGVA